MVKDLEKKLKQFAKKKGIDLFILFGSHAMGQAHSESDVDVAISTKDKPDLLLLTNDLIDLLHENNIDIVDLKRCDPVIGMQALTKGKVIYAKPGTLGTLGSYISRRYADTKKFRDAADQVIDRFVRKRVS